LKEDAMNQREAETKLAEHGRTEEEKALLRQALNRCVFDRGDEKPEPEEWFNRVGPAAIAAIPRPVVEVLLAFARGIRDFGPEADDWKSTGRGDPFDLLVFGENAFWFGFAHSVADSAFSPRRKRR
jgi:hypothetical protein